MGGDTKNAGTDSAEIPVDERTFGPGVSRIDSNDPAAPIYRLLEKMRSPLTLRDMMILPVRTGYISDKIDAELDLRTRDTGCIVSPIGCSRYFNRSL